MARHFIGLVQDGISEDALFKPVYHCVTNNPHEAYRFFKSKAKEMSFDSLAKQLIVEEEINDMWIYRYDFQIFWCGILLSQGLSRTFFTET